MSESPFTDLDRPPLSEAALNRALVRPGGLWSGVTVVDRAGSTNADLAERAKSGEREGAVLIAETQLAGRGRLGRVWNAPPRSGLTFSVLLRPDVPQLRQGWLPLLFGVAAASAVRRVAGVDVRLKWPNDLLVGERKLAGILAERVETGAVVVGMGLNVSLRADELPVGTATSIAIELGDRAKSDSAKSDRAEHEEPAEGGEGQPGSMDERAHGTDRDPLIRAILREIESHYRDWQSAGGDADACGLRAAYQASSATIGREVRVELPGDRILTGTATGVDAEGHLQVGGRTLSAGDVVHVRPAS
ncbi:biotin--[acetyl-CoA-carboxylase] ligase [Nonomuraea africana]|uniref:biotin--[biotin carboxyl-carrier protein] ligase n=1 Tax=Nonomuraea africana TaxID=46171 RepID=A0ABR9KUF0_9ACTN|nr:biotin--[acetyl-CoA-carboxylase] ligase [Nonomuraea africana]MBE1565666.1 BirA family biotin operon repressor/biotin-[acetyl-CoA-carboxylase] ligase [Nonomuraea africana]